MTADTPPSEVVERLRTEIAACVAEELFELQEENAALLRERDAQAKVIAAADKLRRVIRVDDERITWVLAYDAARAGLNTQGSGNG